MSDILWQKYGLSQIDGQRISDVLSLFDEVHEVILFGSRAKGNYKVGSDIDLAIKGTVSKDVLSNLLTAFEETILPYFVDVIVYDNIQNEALKEHIDRVGVSIYQKE